MEIFPPLLVCSSTRKIEKTCNLCGKKHYLHHDLLYKFMGIIHMCNNEVVVELRYHDLLSH